MRLKAKGARRKEMKMFRYAWHSFFLAFTLSPLTFIPFF